MPLKRVLSSSGFISDGELGPMSMTKLIDANLAYRASCFLYSVAGVVMLTVAYDALRLHSPGYYWRVLGILLLFQGPVSYMGDVVCWGVESAWKTVDIFFASGALTALCGPGVICWHLAGRSTFPMWTMAVYAVGIAGGCAAKFLGARRLREGRPRAFILYHTLWHVGLPGVGSVIMVTIACLARHNGLLEPLVVAAATK